MSASLHSKLTVRIPWSETQETIAWNACIFAVEHFGLPGIKYISHNNENGMEFTFNNEQDALIFLLGVA